MSDTEKGMADAEDAADASDMMNRLMALWLGGFASGMASACINFGDRGREEAADTAQSIIDRMMGSPEGRKQVMQEVVETIAGVADSDESGVRRAFWINLVDDGGSDE